LHDEKIRFSDQNNKYNNAITNFEHRMNAKNDEMNKVKKELGNTITLLTVAESKSRELMGNLEQSKEHLAKASADNLKLANDLKAENNRYTRLLEENRQQKSILQIS